MALSDATLDVVIKPMNEPGAASTHLGGLNLSVARALRARLSPFRSPGHRWPVAMLANTEDLMILLPWRGMLMIIDQAALRLSPLGTNPLELGISGIRPRQCRVAKGTCRQPWKLIHSAAVASIVVVSTAWAQQPVAHASVNESSLAAKADTGNTGLVEPIGPPDDPFGDQLARGHVAGALRLTPSVKLGGFAETNPSRTSPSASADSGLSSDLALSVTSARPGGFSASAALGATHHRELDSEREGRQAFEFKGVLPWEGWVFPVNLSYSRNRLARGSLLSEEAFSSQELATRQVATATAASVYAARNWGSTGLLFGLGLTDTDIGSATLVDGSVLPSRASNRSLSLSAKASRPLVETLQWYVRAGMDRYDYAAGDEPVFGSRDSRSPSLAVGLQGAVGKFSGMTEVGRQSKRSDSPLVPDGAAGTAAFNATYTHSPALKWSLGLNRVVIETNIPRVFDLVASAKTLRLDYRFAPRWIIQAGLSHTELEPKPIDGSVTDSGSHATLMWKPDTRWLLALGVKATHRSVSENLAARVNPYSNAKATLTATYYP